MAAVFIMAITVSLSNAQTKTYRTTQRAYERTNQVRNVMETVSDKPVFTVTVIVATTSSYSDYYPYGMQMMGRNESTPSYRYGFQGQENDNEVKGVGNSVNYTYRMHDPRIGRFFAVDPITKKYPELTAYQFSSNRLVDGVEWEGLEVVTLSLEGTASAGASIAAEGGIMIDMSKSEVQIYTFVTTAVGIESNASVSISGIVGYYPDASAQDLEGPGKVKVLAGGGEIVQGSVAISTTENGKKGVLLAGGLGVGLLPISGGAYKTDTEIAPSNLAAIKYTTVMETLQDAIDEIEDKKQEFSEEVKRLNTGIGRSSRRLNELYDILIEKDVDDADWSDLHTEHKLLSENRQKYYDRLDQIKSIRSDLQDESDKIKKVKDHFMEKK